MTSWKNYSNSEVAKYAEQYCQRKYIAITPQPSDTPPNQVDAASREHKCQWNTKIDRHVHAHPVRADTVEHEDSSNEESQSSAK